MAAPIVQHVPIGSIKPNPSNPRTIRDERFHKLVQSIKDFPEMLELRPIVTDADRVVLGGNMRLRACKAAGLKTVPVVIADHLTESQRREFIVKDNVGAGEWNWDVLANEWDAEELRAWNLADIPAVDHASPHTEDREFDRDQRGDSALSYLHNTIRQVVLHYDRETHARVLQRLDAAAKVLGTKDDNAATVIALIEHFETRAKP
jgi:hypothetical protein